MAAVTQDISNNELFLKLETIIQVSTENVKTEIKSEIKELVGDFTQRIESQEHKTLELELKFEELETRFVRLDRQLRKNNFVIFGMKFDTESDLKKIIIEKLKDLLQIEIDTVDILDVFAIKTKTDPLIKVILASFLKKKEVFSNLYKLKNSGISIADDLGDQERRERKILVSHMKEAKSNNLRSRIRGNKLEINGVLHTIDQLNSTGKFSREDLRREASTESSESQHRHTGDNAAVGTVSGTSSVRVDVPPRLFSTQQKNTGHDLINLVELDATNSTGATSVEVTDKCGNRINTRQQISKKTKQQK